MGQRQKPTAHLVRLVDGEETQTAACVMTTNCLVRLRGPHLWKILKSVCPFCLCHTHMKKYSALWFHPSPSESLSPGGGGGLHPLSKWLMLYENGSSSTQPFIPINQTNICLQSVPIFFRHMRTSNAIRTLSQFLNLGEILFFSLFVLVNHCYDGWVVVLISCFPPLSVFIQSHYWSCGSLIDCCDRCRLVQLAGGTRHVMLGQCLLFLTPVHERYLLLNARVTELPARSSLSSYFGRSGK